MRFFKFYLRKSRYIQQRRQLLRDLWLDERKNSTNFQFSFVLCNCYTTETHIFLLIGSFLICFDVRVWDPTTFFCVFFIFHYKYYNLIIDNFEHLQCVCIVGKIKTKGKSCDVDVFKCKFFVHTI